MIQNELQIRVESLWNEPNGFQSLALDIFDYQYSCNPIYKEFVCSVRGENYRPFCVREIPLLPIEIFKQRIIKSGDWDTAQVFKSSGTTQSVRSIHHVRALDWYLNISTKYFSIKFNRPTEIVSLLPNYVENKNSSLIAMIAEIQNQLATQHLPFAISDHSESYRQIMELLESGSHVLLVGVSFALLDFIEKFSVDSNRLHVMYTGGMKNQGKLITDQMMRAHLFNAFPSSNIFSEYGMTELYSQAYNLGDGYRPIPSLEIVLKEVTDPLSSITIDRGQVGLIDLANIDTCSFILSDDLAMKTSIGSYELLGRLDHADLRGCNQLYMS